MDNQMTDWTSGYVADIGYTFGYYNELNPLSATLAFLNAGLAPPTKGGVHCELGFGQGISTNIHAAASAQTWYATDFNPSQAAFAQSMAHASGANAHLTDQAFVEFCGRSDLPDFDSIGLHGIWSWISDENRAVIVDFIRRKLKVGGALYVSYNTLPGWSSFAPMRHLMTQHAHVMGANGDGIVGRVNGALEFAQQLMDAKPLYALANPMVAERLVKVKEQDRNYLAHEYFNRDWQPMHFATMAQWLEPAKVNFACSAHSLDHIDGINLTLDQKKLLSGIPDALFKETVRDFLVNQQFRRDYWVKGPTKLNPIERAQALRAHPIILTSNRADVTLKASGHLGQANMSAEIYNPILDVLADNKPKTIGQIETALKSKTTTIGNLVEVVMVLKGAGHLASIQDAGQIKEAKPFSDKLNAHLISKARDASAVGFLASPVTGGGVGINRFQQLFLLSISEGKKQPQDWAKSAWQIISTQGQRLIKEGKPLETDQENLDELTVQANDFSAKKLPILKSLQVA